MASRLKRIAITLLTPVQPIVGYFFARGEDPVQNMAENARNARYDRQSMFARAEDDDGGEMSDTEFNAWLSERMRQYRANEARFCSKCKSWVEFQTRTQYSRTCDFAWIVDGIRKNPCGQIVIRPRVRPRAYYVVMQGLAVASFCAWAAIVSSPIILGFAAFWAAGGLCLARLFGWA